MGEMAVPGARGSAKCINNPCLARATLASI
jgi:hypothetical protein